MTLHHRTFPFTFVFRSDIANRTANKELTLEHMNEIIIKMSIKQSFIGESFHIEAKRFQFSSFRYKQLKSFSKQTNANIKLTARDVIIQYLCKNITSAFEGFFHVNRRLCSKFVMQANRKNFKMFCKTLAVYRATSSNDFSRQDKKE